MEMDKNFVGRTASTQKGSVANRRAEVQSNVFGFEFIFGLIA
jgi:hypothetical protein